MTTAVRRPTDAALARVTVPADITVVFWVIKLLTTGTGEAASDFFGGLSLPLAGLIGVGGMAAALWWQLRTRTYHPGAYWTAVAMVAVFGTMAADVIHVVLGVPYAISTAAWALVVAGVFAFWFRSEGTLSIHSIDTARRERIYWAAVLATFALGTAAGDWTATQLDLGFLDSAYLFLAAMIVPVLAWRSPRISNVLAFWIAYVLTRPLGASFADWLGKPHDVGRGVGLGDGAVTGVGAALILACVLPLALRARRATVEG